MDHGHDGAPRNKAHDESAVDLPAPLYHDTISHHAQLMVHITASSVLTAQRLRDHPADMSLTHLRLGRELNERRGERD
jgi:hypothetical protein